MLRNILFMITLAVGFAFLAQPSNAQQSSNGAWRFLVSGDSRNCGDVVMPGIAETAKKNHAAFFWHLGDIRATYKIDEDILHQPEHLARSLTMEEYESISWQDYIDSQIKPFGDIPFFVGIGNHEVIAPAKTREGF